MPEFTEEELTLICIYDPGNKTGLIYELRSMIDVLMPDETDLRNLTLGVISKLESMSAEDYERLNESLVPDIVPFAEMEE